MKRAEDVAQAFFDAGLRQFYGVPDSTLQPLISALEKLPEIEIRICVHEGQALSQAAGYFLVTGVVAGVFLQNSGLGNLTNPYTSLICSDVMDFPVFLVVGWRGAPDFPDEPQHVFMGKKSLDLLELLEISCLVPSRTEWQLELKDVLRSEVLQRKCQALLFERDFFDKEPHEKKPKSRVLSRYDSLKCITKSLRDCNFIATTGKTSRELFHIRQERGENHDRDLKIVGAMGHCLGLALGMLDGDQHQKICILDGDGALLMHMGTMVSVPECSAALLHVVFANEVHDSTGGQALARQRIGFEDIAQICGYKHCLRISGLQQLQQFVEGKSLWSGPVMLVVEIATGSIEPLGRPSVNPRANREAFMKQISNHRG